MKDQVDETVKKQRVKALLDLSHTLMKEYAESQLGNDLEVLIEEKDGDYMIGHASNYLKVRVKLSEDSVGHIYSVRIKEVDDVILIGEMISEKD